jgi:hypothetical protein
MSNGLVPHGPTNFYLKVWINILNIKMFLGFNRIHQNVVVFFRILENVVVFIMTLFLGSSDVCQMNFRVLSMSNVLCTYIRMLLDNVFSRFALECVQERVKWICIFMPMILGDFSGPCTVPNLIHV